MGLVGFRANQILKDLDGFGNFAVLVLSKKKNLKFQILETRKTGKFWKKITINHDVYWL